tara:strand:+ start:252 stop:440 length:189 start_codon:yes stop_codon:yes gene_type:complete
MYWVVGMTVGVQDTAVNVHPASLSEHGEYGWESAVEYAMEMTQSLYPNHRVELDYVKEYDYE